MNTRRKIQLGAAAVILNGLGALAGMAPNTALANPCPPVTVNCGLPSCGATPDFPNFVCQIYAPPGCTVTSAICTYAGTCTDPWGVECRYD
jgi:hypothetical protein